MTTTREVEEGIIWAVDTIRQHWDATLDPGLPSGSVAARTPGRGVLADDDDPTDADMSTLDRQINLRLEVIMMLNSWSRVVVEERDLTKALPDGMSAKSMCEFLSRHARWMSGHQAGPDCADELGQWANRVRREAVPRRKDWVTVGRCPVTIAADGYSVACNTPVKIHLERATAIRCQGCGTEDTFDGWVLRMVGSEGPYTAEQLLPVLHRRKGIVVKPSTLRQWTHRHGFPTHGSNDRGQTLYDLRDVLTWLATREKASLSA